MAITLARTELIVEDNVSVHVFNPRSFRQTYANVSLRHEPGMLENLANGTYVFTVTLEKRRVMLRLRKTDG